MTLGREHSLPQGAGEVFTASMVQWPDGKRQRPQRPQHEQPTIDLASQSSLELCSSPPAVPGAPHRPSAQQDFSHQAQPAAVEAHARVSGAAAGQKRLWGEMAADDVTLVGNLGPSSMWGSTRPRARRTRPAAEPAAAAVGSPIVILDEDSPATLSSSMKHQLHLQASQRQERHSNRRIITPLRLNPTSSPPMRPVSISVNPSIASMRAGSAGTGSAQAAAGAVAPPVRRRTVVRRMQAGPMPAPGGGAQGGQRRNSNSSSSSGEVVDLDADAALAHKLVQEEEDRLLAQRLMREEEAAEQARLRANRYELEALQAAVGAAATAAARAGGTAGRGSHRPTTHQAPAPSHMPIMPPGCEAADTARFQRQRENLAVAGAAGTQQQQQQQQQPQRQMVRTFDFGQAMAHMLLSMPMPRAPGRPSSSNTARRGLPASLVQMREAVLGMQRAGLPPHLLFSDRDFTADDYDLLCRLDETVENRKGAAASTIEALPTQTVPAGGLAGAAGERLSCAVCLEEFTEGAELRSLPCLHRFHKGCIDTWLRQKAACPVCNRDCT